MCQRGFFIAVLEKTGVEDLGLGYDSDRDADGEETERRKQLERLEQARPPLGSL